MTQWSTWRDRMGIWLPALVFCVLNLAVFGFYRFAYAGTVEDLQTRSQNDRETLESVRGQRIEMERYLGRVSSSDQGISRLYLEHFETESLRFTNTLAEIKRLARSAGLNPTTLNYPKEDLNDIDLRRLRVNFQVDGTYAQLRQFVNLLEVTDQFLALEQVSLNSSSAQPNAASLTIDLAVSTIFTSESLARRTRQAVLRESTRTGNLSASGREPETGGDEGDQSTVDQVEEDAPRDDDESAGDPGASADEDET